MRLKPLLSLLLPLVSAGLLIAQPEPPADHLEAGRAALAAEGWGEAEMSFRQAIGQQSDSLPAQIGLARALAGGGRLEEALAGLTRVAERWIRGGGYAEAEELLVAGAELAPDDLRVSSLLGRSRVLGRKYLAAEEPLAHVAASGAADVETLLYYGATLWENGRLERSERVLRRAVAESDQSFPAVYQLARLLLWQSRFAEAAELLTGCAERAPEAVDVLLDLGRAQAGAGRPQEALATFQRAVALAPEHSEVRYGLAMALLEGGDRGAAQVELVTYRELYEAEQRRTMETGLEDARIARGRELVRQGRTEEAQAHLRALPESAEALAALAAAQRAAGDLEGSARQLERAVALAPRRTDLRALLNETRLELLRRP